MAPQAASGVALGSVTLPPSQFSETTTADVQAPPERVVFGDSVQLVGSDLANQDNTLQLDLLWAALAPPPSGTRFFVHVVDPADQIVAQVDGTAGTLPGRTRPTGRRVNRCASECTSNYQRAQISPLSAFTSDSMSLKRVNDSLPKSTDTSLRMEGIA